MKGGGGGEERGSWLIQIWSNGGLYFKPLLRTITVYKWTGWHPELSTVCTQFCLWLRNQETIQTILPLGVPTLGLALLALACWLGVVNTFLLTRAFFLLDTGVRGGGKAKMSAPLSWASLFSLFSPACSRSLSLWRRGVVFRPLWEVGLQGRPFSTDGENSL